MPLGCSVPTGTQKSRHAGACRLTACDKGFFRYPGDKTDITGVAEEVWHYRYVGVEAATEMYEKGLCLEEYLAERQAEQ